MINDNGQNADPSTQGYHFVAGGGDMQDIGESLHLRVIIQ